MSRNPEDDALEVMIVAAGADQAPRITPEHIDQMMERVQFAVTVLGGTRTTFAHAYLEGSFYLATGIANCVSPENFRPEIGEEVAIKDAVSKARDKLWELEGYMLWSRLRENNVPEAAAPEALPVASDMPAPAVDA